jgi:hypothetical protein
MIAPDNLGFPSSSQLPGPCERLSCPGSASADFDAVGKPLPTSSGQGASLRELMERMDDHASDVGTDCRSGRRESNPHDQLGRSVVRHPGWPAGTPVWSRARECP